MANKVLLVDDDSAEALLFKQALLECGSKLQATLASGAQAALDILKAWPAGEEPPLVMMDWHMPGMTAEQFIKLLRGEARYRGLIVIVFSGSVAPHELEGAYDAGATAYIVKPSEIEAMCAVIRAVEGFFDVVQRPRLR